MKESITTEPETYRKLTTIRQLDELLKEAIEAGFGDTVIYFDTDARTFEYHLAKVGAASFVPPGSPMAMSHTESSIVLYEESKK